MIPLINHDDWWKPLIETVDEKWGEIISFLPSMTIETTMKKTLNNHSYHYWITINIQYITINNTHSHLILTWFTSTKFQTNPSIVEGEVQTMIRAPVGHLEELDPSSEVGVSPQTSPRKSTNMKNMMNIMKSHDNMNKKMKHFGLKKNQEILQALSICRQF